MARVFRDSSTIGEPLLRDDTDPEIDVDADDSPRLVKPRDIRRTRSGKVRAQMPPPCSWPPPAAASSAHPAPFGTARATGPR
jgi:hypothetical protein